MAKRLFPHAICLRTDTRPCVMDDERIRLSPMPVWSRIYATGGCYINSNAVPTHNAYAHNAIAAHTYDAYSAIGDCHQVPI